MFIAILQPRWPGIIPNRFLARPRVNSLLPTHIVYLTFLLSTPQDEHLKVAHTARISKCRNTLAQIIPFQQRYLPPVAGPFRVRLSKLIAPSPLQLLRNTQFFQPEA